MRGEPAMRVLCACEESQAVTSELRRLGHEAYSCDLLPMAPGPDRQRLRGRTYPGIARAMAEQWAGIGR